MTTQITSDATGVQFLRPMHAPSDTSGREFQNPAVESESPAVRRQE
jgi:hypothetical protein